MIMKLIINREAFMNIKKTLLSVIILIITAANSHPQVNVEKYRMESGKDGTSTDIAVSATLIKGNTEILNINASSGIFYKKGRNELFLKGTVNFGEKNTEKYINKGFVHLRGVRKLTPVLSGEIFAQIEFNEFILLKNRKLGGAGLRVKVLRKKNLSIFAGSGLMYEEEKFSERGGIVLKADTEVFKTTNYISLNCRFNKTSSLGIVTYWQAKISNLADYRFLTDISLQFKLTGSLSFISTINHRYDNDPPMTIKKYDLTIKSGIGINFRTPILRAGLIL